MLQLASTSPFLKQQALRTPRQRCAMNDVRNHCFRAEREQACPINLAGPAVYALGNRKNRGQPACRCNPDSVGKVGCRFYVKIQFPRNIWQFKVGRIVAMGESGRGIPLDSSMCPVLLVNRHFSVAQWTFRIRGLSCRIGPFGIQMFGSTDLFLPGTP